MRLTGKSMAFVALVAAGAVALGGCGSSPDRAGPQQPAGQGTAGEAGSGQSDAIVGGGQATEQYPFMAEITDEAGTAHTCGGTLIAPTWVVTAGHCFMSEDNSNPPDHVRVGSLDRTTGGKLVKIAKVVVHPAYDEDGAHGHDVALLKLAEAVPQSPAKIGPAPRSGDKARALGWGQACPGYSCDSSAKQLKQLDVAVSDDAKCAGDSKFAGSTEICVSVTTAATPCFGDSGGPLLSKIDGEWRVIGATSRGIAYECGEAPEVYTDLTAHFQWINETIGKA